MPFPIEETDARGRTLLLTEPPRRIVSLVPSLTELLADLGLDEAVVGVTPYCVHPEGWRARKRQVGGPKRLDRTALLALAPDLVLASLEENTRDDVEWLDGLAKVHVTSVANLPAALSMMTAVGRLTGAEVPAARLTAAIQAGFAGLEPGPPLRAAYLVWRDPWMVAGADTLIHDLLARGGLVNVFGSRRRYPTVALDDLAAARPDLVLLPSEPYAFGAADAAELQDRLPGARVLCVDGEAFSWYGPRLLETPAAIRRLRSAAGDESGLRRS